MHRRTVLAAVAGGSGSLLAGCLGGGGGGGNIEEVDATVTIPDRGFDPVRLSIDTGQAVEWVNDSEVEHTVSSYSEPFSTSWEIDEILDPGARGTHRFDEAGVYLYRCKRHTRHVGCGAVLVGDASLDQTLTCE